MSKGNRGFNELAVALHQNQRLWTILASSVADSSNQLPDDLRARIFYLAEYTAHQTRQVLREEGDPRVLIEVNMTVMRGLGMERSVR